jgi:hypothetical protein
LTERAEASLAALSEAHLIEITDLAPRLVEALGVLTGGGSEE